MSSSNAWIGITLLVALGSAAGTYYQYNANKAFLATAVTAPGKVLKVIERRYTDSDGYQRTEYTPLIGFMSEDKQNITFKGGHSAKYYEGQELEVIYDAKEPQKAKINDVNSLWGGTIIAAAIGAISLIILCAIMVSKWQRKNLEDYLKTNGRTVTADVIEVYRRRYRRHNRRRRYGRSPASIAININLGEDDDYTYGGWIIKAQWHDDMSNKVYNFESDELEYDPTDLITDQQIEVRIDPKNPKRYIVDLTMLPESGN